MNLKSMLKANMKLKLHSLLLAALLWLVMACEAVDELEIPLSINYVNTPPGLVVKADQDSGRLMIRIEGPRILLLRQKMKGVSVRFDLSGAMEGVVMLSGAESSVKLVQGVKIIRLIPQQVTLSRL